MVKIVFNYKKKRFWAGLLLAQFVLFYIFSKIDYTVSVFERFFEYKKQLHTALFENILLSIGDIFYIIIFGYFFYWLMILLLKKRSILSVRTFLILLNIIYFIYQTLWGMMYFQTPLENKLPEYEITKHDIKELSIIYLHKTIQAREKVSTYNDGSFKINDIEEIKSSIIQGQNKLPKHLIIKSNLKDINIKNSLFGSWMGYSGILGYYNPFSGEAQYNKNLPDTFIPFTIAHETAHQFGYAREQEANFFAYLIGENSTNNELAYATNYFVLKSLLNALHEDENTFVEYILNQYSQGMKIDREKEKKYRIEHQGIIDDFFGMTNDLFLKSNQQEGSITYSYFINLLIRYEKYNTVI